VISLGNRRLPSELDEAPADRASSSAGTAEIHTGTVPAMPAPSD
jgi:hypothetical protein